ncbi:MAG TPA: ABC transporter, partial [Candidatus Polarisedimenticolia bacterium]|nr:ABC transporter [Candidatus Polarisedimenticolia bacterium]
TKLAQTSQYSWGETNEAEIRSHRVTLDPGADTKGPLTIAAAITRKPPTPADPAKTQSKTAPETRLLVFGDSDFLTNASFNAAGNGDLALNAVAWLSEQEDLVSIRPKTSVPRVVILSPQQAFYYFWTIVALAPVIISAVGVVIWVRRKKL